MGWLDGLLKVGKSLLGGAGSVVGNLIKPVSSIAKNLVSGASRGIGDLIGGGVGKIAGFFGGDEEKWKQGVSSGFQGITKTVLPMALGALGGPVGMVASTLLDGDSDEGEQETAQRQAQYTNVPQEQPMEELPQYVPEYIPAPRGKTKAPRYVDTRYSSESESYQPITQNAPKRMKQLQQRSQHRGKVLQLTDVPPY